jgi:hypothetical protein
MRGTPNFPPDPIQPSVLRLVTLTANGRGRTQESGGFGRGIWFEAKGNDRYAIGQRDGRFIIVQHWGTATFEAQIADASGDESNARERRVEW